MTERECWEELVPGPVRGGRLDLPPSRTGADCARCDGPGYLLADPPEGVPEQARLVQACPECAQLDNDAAAALRAALHRGWRMHADRKATWYIVPPGVAAW